MTTTATGVLRLAPRLKGRVAVIHPLFWGLCESRDGVLHVTVESVFAGVQRDKASPGDQVQTAEGDWITK